MEQTGCAICSTGRELMTPDGRTTGKYIPVKERITYRELLKHNSINCSSVLLRREDALAFPMEHDNSMKITLPGSGYWEREDLQQGSTDLT